MSFAATISSPKAGSGGPAVLTHIFPPQGQIFPADTHPGLVPIPGSQSVLDTPAVVSPGREPCGRAVLCLRRDRISIPLGRELGGEAADGQSGAGGAQNPRADRTRQILAAARNGSDV